MAFGGVMLQRLADRLYLHPALLLFLLLVPPLLWLGVFYLGSLFFFLSHAFFHIDDFTGQIVYRFTLSTLATVLTTPANLDIVLRTLFMAVATTLASMLLAFPLALYISFHTRGQARHLWLTLVVLPLWSSYLIRVYAGKLILAEEGVVSWIAHHLGLGSLLDLVLAIPFLGGPSLSSSYLGMLMVFTYIWLPYMVLPVQNALDRVPRSLVQAASDLGASPWVTLRTVVLPLAVPGLAAGSIFTFSLTLGDYIIPTIMGPPGYFIGQMVYIQQGTAGDLPLAAAFSFVPMALIGLYLLLARRLGAFENL